MKKLLLRGARQLLTMRRPAEPSRHIAYAGLGILTEGSVLIRDGVIVNVGPSRRIDNLAEARDADVIEAHGAVVMPAFVDASTGIPESPAGIRRFLSFALAHGTAALSIAGELSELRALASADLPRMRRVTTWNVNAAELPLRGTRASLVEFAAIDLHTFPASEVRSLHAQNLLVRSTYSDSDGVDWIALALAVGSSLLDVDSVTPWQAKLLADSQVPAVFAPANGGDLRCVLDAGGIAALGSGFGLPGGYTCSMQTVIGIFFQEFGLDPAVAIRLATCNAASALGIGDETGSIEVGKQADLLVLHLSDYRDFSNYFGMNAVAKMIVAGNLMA